MEICCSKYHSFSNIHTYIICYPMSVCDVYFISTLTKIYFNLLQFTFLFYLILIFIIFILQITSLPSSSKWKPWTFFLNFFFFCVKIVALKPASFSHTVWDCRNTMGAHQMNVNQSMNERLKSMRSNDNKMAKKLKRCLSHIVKVTTLKGRQTNKSYQIL